VGGRTDITEENLTDLKEADKAEYIYVTLKCTFKSGTQKLVDIFSIDNLLSNEPVGFLV
jgi:hypothetical protein